MTESYCMVVAHPDDETLFGGGILAAYNHLKWTVICCSTPKADPERAEKFYDACYEFNVTPSLIDVPEGDTLAGVDFLNLKHFDHIVTHGAAGEYGHYNHKQVHRFIKERWPHKKLSFFGHGGGEHCKLLTPDQSDMVMRALKCYNHTSIHDSKPKWEAIIDRYKPDFTKVYYDGCEIGLSGI